MNSDITCYSTKICKNNWGEAERSPPFEAWGHLADPHKFEASRSSKNRGCLRFYSRSGHKSQRRSFHTHTIPLSGQSCSSQLQIEALTVLGVLLIKHTHCPKSAVLNARRIGPHISRRPSRWHPHPPPLICLRRHAQDELFCGDACEIANLVAVRVKVLEGERNRIPPQKVHPATPRRNHR